jgi:hypothetical protein
MLDIVHDVDKDYRNMHRLYVRNVGHDRQTNNRMYIFRMILLGMCHCERNGFLRVRMDHIFVCIMLIPFHLVRRTTITRVFVIHSMSMTIIVSHDEINCTPTLTLKEEHRRCE